MNRTALLSLAAIVAVVVGLTFALGGESYVPQTDTLTFERVIDNDEGRQLNPADLVSKENVRLADVFSPTTGKFTQDRLSRHGADRTNEEGGGVGLLINFVHKDGEETNTKSYRLSGWKTFEETTRPTRRTEVENSQPQLAEAINLFIAPVSIKRAFGVTLDTTEGVTPDLAKRVQRVIDGTRAVTLGSNPKNTVVLSLYSITENPYQGGMEQPNLTKPEEIRASVEWLLRERPSQGRSSVLLGVKAIAGHMMTYRDSRPILHVFTDGLENTDRTSVYKTPSLLDGDKWATLDEVANLAGLNLEGLTVYLHPLPATSARHAAMMEKAHAYLANRLTTAKAKVTVEPF